MDAGQGIARATARKLARLEADRERRRRWREGVAARHEIADGVEAAARAEARKAHDRLLPTLHAMGHAPLPPGRTRRSLDWRLVADALAAGIEPALVAAALELSPDRLHRILAGKTRLRRYLEQANAWRRVRIECALAELDQAAARAVALRLEQGDRRVLHLALQRLRQRALPAPRQRAIGTRLDPIGRNSDE